jgi:predicted nucleic acid-binding protein
MSIGFLDTNILLRFLTRDDERKARCTLELLMRVERGEEKVITSPLVIFETVYTLQSFYKVPRQTIKEQVLAIISMRSLQLPDKNIFYQAFNFYVTKNISFADAYNAAYMLAEGISNIYSWDKDFDKIEGIGRLEPEEK